MKNLKELRVQRNITGRQLAEVLNITYTQIYNWENGKNEPDIATFKKLARYFECSIDFLLDFDSANEKKAEIVKEIKQCADRINTLIDKLDKT